MPTMILTERKKEKLIMEMNVTKANILCDFEHCLQSAEFQIFVDNSTFAQACERHSIHYQNLANAYIKNKES